MLTETQEKNYISVFFYLLLQNNWDVIYLSKSMRFHRKKESRTFKYVEVSKLNYRSIFI